MKIIGMGYHNNFLKLIIPLIIIVNNNSPCTAPERLSTNEMGFIVVNLKCTLSGIGKRKNSNKEDYWLEEKDSFSGNDFELIKKKGLVVLISQEQIKSFSQEFNLDELLVIY